MMEIWSERAGNPEAFGEMEKSLYNEVEPIIKELLEELKRNNRIETITTPAEYDQLRSVIGEISRCQCGSTIS